ncbi:MAG: ribosome small subunit-dependent GTPase A, partial [Paraclostridium sp.]
MIDGIIIKGIGGFYYVDTNQGLYECRARGIFRKDKIIPLVGDKVKIGIVDEENKKGVVEEIKERETELVRPPISNVNKSLIVFAIKDPAPNLSLLDRFIVLAEKEGLDTVIVLTKVDLSTIEEVEKIKNIYELSGYKVIPVSNKENLNIEKIKDELRNNIVVFAGPSGVGKSSLLNHIDSKFKLQTGEVSDKIKRGKHTTRHAELL